MHDYVKVYSYTDLMQKLLYNESSVSVGWKSTNIEDTGVVNIFTISVFFLTSSVCTVVFSVF